MSGNNRGTKWVQSETSRKYWSIVLSSDKVWVMLGKMQLNGRIGYFFFD